VYSNLEIAVQKANLTKLEKKIAEYVLKNSEEIPFLTALELARRLNVSDTSVIRTTRTLGFSGFSDFQKSIQHELLLKMQEYNNSLSPKMRVLSKNPNREGKNLLLQGLNLALDHLNDAFLNNNEEKLNHAVDIIINSRQKFLCGYRGSASLVYFLAQKLRLFLPSVHTLLTGDSEMIERLSDISSEDCLFVCSYPRYNHIVMAAIEIALRANAKIIALTDKVTSPIARDTTVVLVADADFPGFCNSYTAPMFLCDLLLLLLSEKINMESNKKADLIEEYSQKMNINYMR